MNTFTQHVPAFVDIDRPSPIQFETTEDLLSLEIVGRYKENCYWFVMDGNTLMMVKDDGFYWWVVGFIEKSELIKLPKWEGPKYKALLDNKEVILTRKEVHSSRLDTLTLRDGRTAKDLKYNS